MVRRKISPSAPTRLTPAAPTERFCGLIILPITPPEELVPAVRMGFSGCPPITICWAVWACIGPNSVLDAVSLPVKKTPSAPMTAEKKGKNPPAFAMRRASVDVMPEKFITAAIPRMNAIVMMGRASWRSVRP